MRAWSMSEFDEFKKLYGQTLICGFAHIWDIRSGFIANNGILFSESSLKARHFIELCCSAISLVFLQNIRLHGCKKSKPAASRAGGAVVEALAGDMMRRRWENSCGDRRLLRGGNFNG